MLRHHAIPAAYVIVWSGSRILLSRRLNTGHMDGRYQLPAGHVEPGEMPAETAVRELKEEVGLAADVAALEFAHAAYREKHNDTGDRLDVFFSLRQWTGEISNPEPHKSGGWEWHDVDRLPDDTIPFIRQILAAVQARCAYSEHKN